MAVKLWSNKIEQFCDSTGVPRAGAKLFTYVGGSVNTKQTTYTESTGVTPNTNPIVLDANGKIPQPIWLTTGVNYKFVLAPPTDTDPPTSPIDTIDVVTGINDTTLTVDQWIAAPTPTYVSATSFTLSGDQTTNAHRGRRLKFTVTAGTKYGTIQTSTFAASLTTVVVLLDSGSLDSGLSAASYGVQTYDNTSASNLSIIPPGLMAPYGGSSTPTGWLLCDGSAVSRTAYAALFAAIGTTWGAGDLSTTFNLPPSGRLWIGSGTPTTVETITSQLAAGNAVPVASNNTKWITGMPVTVSAASGFVGLVNGSFFIVRASSTTIQIATTLANAQNGTVVVVTGTGSATLTSTFTARTLGEMGGEEGHAMSSTELLAHIHGVTDPTHSHTSPIRNAPPGASTTAGEANANPGDSTVATNAVATGISINSTGGNAAMNIMQLFGVVRYIIKT